MHGRRYGLADAACDCAKSSDLVVDSVVDDAPAVAHDDVVVRARLQPVRGAFFESALEGQEVAHVVRFREIPEALLSVGRATVANGVATFAFEKVMHEDLVRRGRQDAAARAQAIGHRRDVAVHADPVAGEDGAIPDVDDAHRRHAIQFGCRSAADC